MSDYYSEPQTLLQSIEKGDIRAIHRCLKAGQSLSQSSYMFYTSTHGFIHDFDPLWRVALHKCNSLETTLTILAFKKDIDLNATMSWDGRGDVNALWSCHVGKPEQWHLLIQNGIDVNQEDDYGESIIDLLISTSDNGESTLERIYDKIIIMLLSVGANPTLVSKSRKVREQVGRWLKGLATAKVMFKDIFDNEELEKELCEFLYTEESLLKVIGQ